MLCSARISLRYAGGLRESGNYALRFLEGAPPYISNVIRKYVVPLIVHVDEPLFWRYFVLVQGLGWKDVLVATL